MSDAERQRLCRQRKRTNAQLEQHHKQDVIDQLRLDADLPVTEQDRESSRLVTDLPVTVTALLPTTGKKLILPTAEKNYPLSSLALTAAAIGLAGTGLTMNGWFAGRSDRRISRDGCFSPLASRRILRGIGSALRAAAAAAASGICRRHSRQRPTRRSFPGYR
jgi:hypothetical protein